MATVAPAERSTDRTLFARLSLADARSRSREGTTDGCSTGLRPRRLPSISRKG